MPNLRGFTLVEMAVTVTIISLLVTASVILISPVQMRRKGHDVARLVDLNSLLQAIENYTVDHDVPPDQESVLRLSNQAVTPSQAPQLSDGRGWLGVDLSGILAKLPTDPLNVFPYIYRYKRVGKKFELNAVMEAYTDLMTEDGGNDNGQYEVGTDLELL